MARRAKAKARPAAAPHAHKGIATRTWWILAGLAGLAALLTLVAPSAPLEAFLDANTRRAEDGLSEARASAHGPPVVWIRIGGDGPSWHADGGHVAPAPRWTSDTDAQGNRITSRDALASVLRRIRTAGASARPLLVFLDIAIGSDAPSQRSETPLITELQSWKADPAAPPLAIDAGRSCFEGAGQQPTGGTDSDTVVPFQPGPYANLVSPAGSGHRDMRSRMQWSCPVFPGLWQTEWSCVTGSNDLFALPSPAWFAAALRQPDHFASALGGDLVAADRSCRQGGGDAPANGRPKFSRVNIVPGSATMIKGWENGHANGSGREILHMVTAADVVDKHHDLGALAGAIVVIGGGNQDSPDIVETEKGPIAGSLLTAGTLRDAYISGMEVPPSGFTNFAETMVFLAISLVILNAVKEKRGPWTRNRRKVGLPIFILLHEQLVVAGLVALIFLLPYLLAVRLTLPLAVTVVLIEIFLFVESIREGWKHVHAD